VAVDLRAKTVEQLISANAERMLESVIDLQTAK
jgi:hypothetical protein